LTYYPNGGENCSEGSEAVQFIQPVDAHPGKGVKTSKENGLPKEFWAKDDKKLVIWIYDI
jgi:hypothetical protein